MKTGDIYTLKTGFKQNSRIVFVLNVIGEKVQILFTSSTNTPNSVEYISSRNGMKKYILQDKYIYSKDEFQDYIETVGDTVIESVAMMQFKQAQELFGVLSR